MSKTSGPLDAGGQSLSAVPVPDLAASCPSVLEDVLKENLSGNSTATGILRAMCARAAVVKADRLYQMQHAVHFSQDNCVCTHRAA